MNAAYKQIAYERAVLLALIRTAKEKFLPVEGEDQPETPIECEELPRNESMVPEDSVIDVVMKLQRLVDRRELEMSKFEFVEKEHRDEQEWTAEEERATGGSKAKPPAPGGQGKGAGGKGNGTRPAAHGGGSKPAHPGAQAPNRSSA